jgi:hypothetical protein
MIYPSTKWTDLIAVGNAHGSHAKEFSDPERVELIPKIPFVIFNVVFFQDLN